VRLSGFYWVRLEDSTRPPKIAYYRSDDSYDSGGYLLFCGDEQPSDSEGYVFLSDVITFQE
jgi:hypothetical protein